MTPTATPTASKVIEQKKFVAVDPANNNNKFWQYSINSDGTITYTWGRIGATSDSKTEPYVEKKLASKVREKLNKKDGPSYVEIKTVGGDGPMVPVKAVAKAEVAKIAVKEIGGDDPIVSALVKKLAEANRHEIITMSGGEMDVDLETGIVRTAMGVVTLDAVKQARKILDDMSSYVTRGNTDNPTYQRMLGDYLKLVPQKVPFKRGWYADFINLDTQTQLLDQLESSIELAEQRVTDSIAAANKTDRKSVPTVFNISLKVVDDPKVFDKIKKMYYDNRSHGHSCAHLKPVRVYEVQIPHMAASFETDGKRVGNIKRLWHGTRMHNVLSILKRGFVLPSQLSTVQTTGAMYGAGLYFSDTSTKSLNYSYGGVWDNGRRDRICFMFLADVAMGREYIPYSSGNGKRVGYDSCFAQGGKAGTINNEMIVYRTSQANIRYLVEFSE